MKPLAFLMLTAAALMAQTRGGPIQETVFCEALVCGVEKRLIEPLEPRVSFSFSQWVHLRFLELLALLQYAIAFSRLSTKIFQGIFQAPNRLPVQFRFLSARPAVCQSGHYQQRRHHERE